MSVNCQCGVRMACIETRASGADVRRRYSCACGKRATTKEVLIDFDAGPLLDGNPARPHARLIINRGPAPRHLAEAAQEIVGRAALYEFCDKYCLNQPALVACAESAFYWFNKVAASTAPISPEKAQ